MIRRPKLLIASLVLIAFGIAILVANGPERAKNVADELVEATSVLPENEGKLVIVSGTPLLADGGVLVDDEAGLQVENAVFYSRIPLQKVYVEKSRVVVIDQGEDKMSEVDDIKETEYYVAMDWINANHKRDAVIKNGPTRYENPAPINLDSYHAAGDLRVGGFRVSAADVYDYIKVKNAWFSRGELEQACGHYITRSEIDLKAITDDNGRGMLSSGDEIGDVHVFFSYETLEGAETVTIVGRQRGDELVLEEDDIVSESESVRPGSVTREEFLDSITSEDASSRWYGIGGVALGLALLVASLDLRRS